MALLTPYKSNLNNALSGGADDTIFLQAAVYPHNIELDQGNQAIALVTRSSARGELLLPYTYANGSLAYLGDDGIGYPPKLFPNFTFGEQLSDQTHVLYDNKRLTSNSTLLLGPFFLKNNLSLISMTLAINSECLQFLNTQFIPTMFDCRVASAIAAFHHPRNSADLIYR
jgi:osomolarity two-component system sensor histidine kinase SLN1